MIRRIKNWMYLWAAALTATPVCGEDCDCRNEHLADLGVCQDECCWVDEDTPRELYQRKDYL